MKEKTYRDADKTVDALVSKEKYEEAFTLLYEMKNAFTENMYEITSHPCIVVPKVS